MNSNGLRKREFFSQVMDKVKKCFANYLPILSPDDEIGAFCNQCEDGLPLTCELTSYTSFPFPFYEQTIFDLPVDEIYHV
ncbi:hypothetical protein HanPSC8_Chr10g0415451 [Helianthus annuus]|nr:hypothetical protein HanPSC8_Chr10g0415451 [Helianthus annuus]